MVPEKRLLVLASSSPRRRQLLGIAGFMFSTLSVKADESVLPGEDPRGYALRVSELKATLAAEQVLGQPLILSADTVVADRGEILGKPHDAQEAERMLKQLCGRTHQVHTAITVLDTVTGQIEQELATTDVPMRAYTDDEMSAYIATGDPFDKAGSYAIQHPIFSPARTRTGCYANVIGLPLCHFLKVLRRMNIPVHQDIPYLCQSAHEYECGVFHGILRS
jgi:septum formation protein